MNIKRWFAWTCFVLMLVAEFFLFRANHGRDVALVDLRVAQHELQQARTELDELKNSNAGLQAAENQRLRKQNGILTNKLATLQMTVDQLKSESQATARHLTTARTALQLQQEHLQQLQTEKQQAVSALDQQNACINNLRIIDAAKQQWALEKNQTVAAVPVAEDLVPYLKDGIFPSCPAGGLYSINAVGEMPTCSIAGHALVQ
jgi:FtsZ-binding cell division protein ZapB